MRKCSLKSGVVVFILLAAGLAAQAEEWPGKKSSFHSFDQYDFSVGEMKCKVVVPRQVAAGKPWVWRARFFGHEPQTDIALLEKGFHVAYVDVRGLYGSPEAVARWNAFYEYLTTTRGLAKKPALEGMSRGGLIIYNWASKNADKVACIYGDAPVCDIKSWPGTGKKGAEMLEAYGFTPEQAETFRGNPVDNLKPLAEAGVPLLHVVGDADAVVPVSENTAVMEQRYKEFGGSVQVIHKPGIGHHPHSLKAPAPIVAFILQHALASESVRVACVGDSITFGARIKDRANKSYPAQLADMLGAGYVVENFGVSGATLLKKGNKPYWRTNRFKPAHDFNPDIVIIALGTNDSKPGNWEHKAEFISDYLALIDSFRALESKPKVYVCSPVPAYSDREGRISGKVVKDEVLPFIDQIIEKSGVEKIDLFSALSNKQEFFPDSIHPNAQGAGIMAEAIRAIITGSCSSQ